MSSYCQAAEPELRTTRSTVTFSAPFRLQGISPVQPAGTYKVDSDERTMLGSGPPATVATRLYLRIGGSLRIRAVDGRELQAAWDEDQAPLAAAGPIA